MQNKKKMIKIFVSMNRKKKSFEKRIINESSIDSSSKSPPEIIEGKETAKFGEDLITQLTKASENLYYISETDAPWEVFTIESEAQEDLLSALKKAFSKTNDSAFEEISFENFFEKLTKVQEWFGSAEIDDTRKYLKVKELLEKNLTELKVYRFGRIRVEIFVAGKDFAEKIVVMKTEAVET